MPEKIWNNERPIRRMNTSGYYPDCGLVSCLRYVPPCWLQYRIHMQS